MIIYTIIIYSIIICLIGSFTPQIFLIEKQIKNLEIKNYQLAKLRKNSSFTWKQNVRMNQTYLPIFHSPHIIFNQKCKIQGDNIEYFVFQTVQFVYIAINHPSLSSLRIYNMQCQFVSEIQNVQIFTILCDRGICQSGIIHFLGKDEILYKIEEVNKFTQLKYLIDLKINNSRIMDGMVRYRQKDKLQIYIYYENGEVRVINQKGNLTNTFNLQGQNNIIQIADHHPYPFVITKMNWISIVDTINHNEISHNCPYIPNIKYIVIESIYGDSIYLITNHNILHLQIDTNKKICSIKQAFPLQKQIQTIQKATIFYNLMFIDNKVYNLTDKRLYIRQKCKGKSTIQFINKKHHQEDIYSVENCCIENKCTAQIYNVKKNNKEDKNILMWIILIFVIIIFISILFMKKSTISNLDFDDSQRSKDIQVQKQIYQLTKRQKKMKK